MKIIIYIATIYKQEYLLQEKLANPLHPLAPPAYFQLADFKLILSIWQD